MLSPLPRADGHGQLTGMVPFDRQPSLALAVVTAGPAVRLRALLEIMRPHVDEIVVGIDQHGDPAPLDACVDIADRRLALDLRDAAGTGRWPGCTTAARRTGSSPSTSTRCRVRLCCTT